MAKRSQGRGCPYCANRRTLAGFNDLASRSPDLGAQWHLTANDRLASEVSPWSTYQATWTCPEGHEYVMAVKRRSRGLGCTVCAGYVVQSGVNDLASQAPELAAQIVDVDPATISLGGHTPRRWRCALDHEWSAAVKTRVAGHGCPYCSNLRVLPGFNDLATTHPGLAAQWDVQANAAGPDSVTAGSRRKAHWKCGEGHRWIAVVHSRKERECPECSLRGTSRVEQALYDAVAAHQPEAQHRAALHVASMKRPYEVDILLGNLVIEYDGSYFHGTPEAIRRDLHKTRGLLSAGYRVVRVREESHSRLPPLPVTHPSLSQLHHRFGDPVEPLARRVLSA